MGSAAAIGVSLWLNPTFAAEKKALSPLFPDALSPKEWRSFPIAAVEEDTYMTRKNHSVHAPRSKIGTASVFLFDHAWDR